jgi:hypothetical protein
MHIVPASLPDWATHCILESQGPPSQQPEPQVG